MTDKTDADAKPRPYHHGDLRNGLLEAARTILEEEDLSQLTLRAVARKAERVLATDTATRAGDDRDSSLTQLGHDCDSFSMHSSDV